jgi:SAM-dependent methyltransferase
MPDHAVIDTYEDLLYEEAPYTEAHPSLLLARVALAGLTPPDPSRIRVLELGCALGGHLLPLAALWPQATWVGLDLSEPQIARARARARAAGLERVDLRVADVATVDPDSLGTFDVIVCHGVYTWVPPAARRGIRRILARCLAPRGIAYVSVNTEPGWGLRGILRRVLARTDRPEAPDAERVKRAREVLAVWSQALAGRESAPSVALREEVDRLRGTGDPYIRYEHLAAINEPVWLDALAGDMAEAGLLYLGDASLLRSLPTFDPQVASWIEAEAAGARDPMVARETLHDQFLVRMFRRTLWMRREARPDRRLVGERLAGLTLVSRLVPDDADDIDWRIPDGLHLTDVPPHLDAALHALHRARPGGLSTEAIHEAVARAGHLPDPRVRRRLNADLLELLRLEGLHAWHGFPPLATTPPHRPRATALARLQAAAAGDTPFVADLLHRQQALRRTEAALLRGCDGTRDREALVDVLLEALDAGQIRITGDDGPVTDRATLGQVVDALLADLTRRALFLQG